MTPEERTNARKRGGRALTRLANLERSLESSPTLLNILHALGRASDRLERGEITPSVATGMASLARAMVATATLAEQGARLQALTQLLDAVEAGEYNLDALDSWDDDE